MTKIASRGAYDVMGNCSSINQGDGERLFLNSVGRLETMLTEMRSDLSKYFKKDEEFEKAREGAVAEATKNR